MGWSRCTSLPRGTLGESDAFFFLSKKTMRTILYHHLIISWFPSCSGLLFFIIHLVLLVGWWFASLPRPGRAKVAHSNIPHTFPFHTLSSRAPASRAPQNSWPSLDFPALWITRPTTTKSRFLFFGSNSLSSVITREIYSSISICGGPSIVARRTQWGRQPSPPWAGMQ